MTSKALSASPVFRELFPLGVFEIAGAVHIFEASPQAVLPALSERDVSVFRWRISAPQTVSARVAPSPFIHADFAIYDDAAAIAKIATAVIPDGHRGGFKSAAEVFAPPGPLSGKGASPRRMPYFSLSSSRQLPAFGRSANGPPTIGLRFTSTTPHRCQPLFAVAPFRGSRQLSLPISGILITNSTSADE